LNNTFLKISSWRDERSIVEDISEGLYEAGELFNTHIVDDPHLPRIDRRDAFWRTMTDDFDGKNFANEELREIIHELQKSMALFLGSIKPSRSRADTIYKVRKYELRNALTGHNVARFRHNCHEAYGSCTPQTHSARYDCCI
jgi:hypothetical protein